MGPATRSFVRIVRPAGLLGACCASEWGHHHRYSGVPDVDVSIVFPLLDRALQV